LQADAATIRSPSATRARITLVLRADSTPGCPPELCIVGHLEGSVDSLLATPPQGASVVGRLVPPDSVSLQLGECCDRGALLFYGRVHGDELRGSWGQALWAFGDAGDLRLRRVGQ
jgi:hypothetical protein